MPVDVADVGDHKVLWHRARNEARAEYGSPERTLKDVFTFR
jgi:hypothetical protein